MTKTLEEHLVSPLLVQIIDEGYGFHHESIMSATSQRRKHRKSRRGCRTCKSRHIKCDENRPECVNCTTSDLKCSFIEDGETISSSVTPLPFAELSQQVSPHPSNPEELNLEQIELTYHYLTNTCTTLTQIPSSQLLWREVAMKDALHTPYLMYGILAISALHLSYCQPDRANHWGHRAVELQVVALQEFNLALPEVNSQNFVPAMMFSGLLGVHVFADPARSRDFYAFLDHITHWIKLSRGTKSIVKTFWQEVRPTRYAGLFDIGLIDPHEPLELNKLPPEMLNLTKLIEPDQTMDSTYSSTISQLYRVYLSNLRDPRMESRFSAVFAWISLVPDSYHDAIEQRRPEALVILAYYAVLLHQKSHHWAFGDAGVILIEGIRTHLGKHWHPWLEWPMQIIQNPDSIVQNLDSTPQSLDTAIHSHNSTTHSLDSID